jgi:hypothetical protein
MPLGHTKTKTIKRGKVESKLKSSDLLACRNLNQNPDKSKFFFRTGTGGSQ